MNSPSHIQSIFSQKLDRAVFATYFLGSVIPTGILAGVVQHYVLPNLGSDGDATVQMVGMLLGVGLLSLASFFALRRLVHGALDRMDADNHRLATILGASRELAQALHTHAVADTAAGCALSLTGAQASYVLLQAARGKPLLVCESAGDDAAALYQTNQDRLGELLESALASDAPVSQSLGAPAAGAPSAVAIVPLRVDGGLQGAFVLLHTRRGAAFTPEEIDAVSSLAGFTSVAFQNADLQSSQRNFFSHVTDILVTALDAQLDRGDARAGHPHRIAAVANSIGRELGLDEERLQCLHFAALLHDIGYLKIDRALHHDAAACQSHPMLGYRMLSRIRLWQDVAPVVLHHHEWFDGSGYPESRTGSDIPLESRIVAVADVFDKLTNEDYERPARSVPETLAELEQGAGAQFDPRVVEALAAVVSRGELVS